jgi:ribonuclease HIII
VAREIAKKSGPEGLRAVSKFHFKTFREVIEGIG